MTTGSQGDFMELDLNITYSSDVSKRLKQTV